MRPEEMQVRGGRMVTETGHTTHLDENGERQTEEDVAEEGPAVGPAAVLRQRRDKHLPAEFGLSVLVKVPVQKRIVGRFVCRCGRQAVPEKWVARWPGSDR